MEGVPRIPMYASDIKCQMNVIDFEEPVKRVNTQFSGRFYFASFSVHREEIRRGPEQVHESASWAQRIAFGKQNALNILFYTNIILF